MMPSTRQARTRGGPRFPALRASVMEKVYICDICKRKFSKGKIMAEQSAVGLMTQGFQLMEKQVADRLQQIEAEAEAKAREHDKKMSAIEAEAKAKMANLDKIITGKFVEQSKKIDAAKGEILAEVKRVEGALNSYAKRADSRMSALEARAGAVESELGVPASPAPVAVAKKDGRLAVLEKRLAAIEGFVRGVGDLAKRG